MRESNKLSIKAKKTWRCQSYDSMWDSAIADAEREIIELRKKRARLEQAVRIFRENKKDGVKWPGGKRGTA